MERIRAGKECCCGSKIKNECAAAGDLAVEPEEVRREQIA
jgi:hypothetical protein